jgi:hypothetical protein
MSTLFRSFIVMAVPGAIVRDASSTATLPLALAYNDANNTPHTITKRADPIAITGLLLLRDGFSLSKGWADDVSAACAGLYIVSRATATVTHL